MVFNVMPSHPPQHAYPCWNNSSLEIASYGVSHFHLYYARTSRYTYSILHLHIIILPMSGLAPEHGHVICISTSSSERVTNICLKIFWSTSIVLNQMLNLEKAIPTCINDRHSYDKRDIWIYFLLNYAFLYIHF